MITKNELELLQLQKAKQQSVKKISRSILNKSTSKQLAFFAKAERFPSKIHSISQQNELPQTSRSNSSCSSARIRKFPTIPQAERVLYFDKEKQLCLNPSPQTYNIRSEEEIFKITHKGGTIGARFNSVPHIRQVTPSAMDYQKESLPIQKSFNRSFTFERSQRNLMKVLTKQGKDSPGPKYDIENKIKEKQLLPSFHIKGETKPRKYRNKPNKLNVLAIPNINRFTTLHLEKFGKEKSLKIDVQRTQNTQRGHSIKKNIGFSTTRRQRVHTLPQKNPGPGTYVFFSEFSGWM